MYFFSICTCGRDNVLCMMFVSNKERNETPTTGLRHPALTIGYGNRQYKTEANIT